MYLLCETHLCFHFCPKKSCALMIGHCMLIRKKVFFNRWGRQELFAIKIYVILMFLILELGEIH